MNREKNILEKLYSTGMPAGYWLPNITTLIESEVALAERNVRVEVAKSFCDWAENNTWFCDKFMIGPWYDPDSTCEGCPIDAIITANSEQSPAIKEQRAE